MVNETVRPSVSIALATFNGSRFLEQQLASFTSQTRLPDQLVVCDDVSEDSTLQIIDDYARQAPFPVKILTNLERLGPGPTFERAIIECGGDIVFLSDQDDVWLPLKLERVLDHFITDESILVVIHDLAIADAQLKPTGFTQLGRIDRMRIPRATHVTGSASAFRASVRSLLLPFPPAIRTYDAWIHSIGDALGRRVIVDEVLSLYRRHAGTATRAVTATWNPMRLGRAVRQTLERESDVATGERSLWLGEMQSRFDAASDEDWIALGDIDRVAVDAFFRTQRVAIERRLDILDTNRPSRFWKVVRALRDGIYDQFAGPGSAVRDALWSRRRSGGREGAAYR